jgi:hypothetical protein
MYFVFHTKKCKIHWSIIWKFISAIFKVNWIHTFNFTTHSSSGKVWWIQELDSTVRCQISLKKLDKIKPFTGEMKSFLLTTYILFSGCISILMIAYGFYKYLTLVSYHIYILTYSTGQSPSWEANRFSAQTFYGTHNGSLTHSQVPATCSYPQPDQSCPCPHIPLPDDPS